MRTLVNHFALPGAVALLALATPSGDTHAPNETLVLSGGCYWTMETVFEHMRGVVDVVSGGAGTAAKPAAYVRNTTGTLGFAEAVRVTYNPKQISLEDLLKVYFTVAHDPTEVNRQGPDVGSRYRSVIWTTTETQQKAAFDYLAALQRSLGPDHPVATQIAALDDFVPVRESEQDFAEKNPDHPYIVYWDRPKLRRFREALPALYRERDERP